MTDQIDPQDPASEPASEPTPAPASPPPWDATGAATGAVTGDATPPKKPWYRRPVAAVGGAVAAVVGFGLWKIAFGFFAASIVGGAVTSVFGSQWDRLPSDVRSSITHRLDAAYGESLKDLSDAAVVARLKTDVRQGALRLDDAALIRHLQIETAAVDIMPVAQCGTFGRDGLASKAPPDAVWTALQDSMSDSEYQEWMEIAVRAVEAERRGSPAVRVVSDADQSAAIQAWVGTLSGAELQLFQAVASDANASDEDACTVIRTLYDRALAMDPDTLAVIAYIDVASSP